MKKTPAPRKGEKGKQGEDGKKSDEDKEGGNEGKENDKEQEGVPGQEENGRDAAEMMARSTLGGNGNGKDGNSEKNVLDSFS